MRTFQFVMVPRYDEGYNPSLTAAPHCQDIVVTICHETQAAAESWLRRMFLGWSAKHWSTSCLDVTDAPDAGFARLEAIERAAKDVLLEAEARYSRSQMQGSSLKQLAEAVKA